MAVIQLRNATVDFPVYNGSTRSLKNRVLRLTTGGLINTTESGQILVRGLSDINLDIGDGERVGLVGHNGSGKTTLLRVFSGIYRPTEGSAQVEGDCVSLINISLGIDPEATGRENIRLRATMMGMDPNDLLKRFAEIADFSGLGDFLDMPLRTYSSGMQLRLAFSVSTAIRPEILIMDEWLSTGDEDFKVRADERLRQIVDSTKILVLASHSRQLLDHNCDRIIWLEHGQIKQDGPASEVLASYFGSN